MNEENLLLKTKIMIDQFRSKRLTRNLPFPKEIKDSLKILTRTYSRTELSKLLKLSHSLIPSKKELQLEELMVPIINPLQQKSTDMSFKDNNFIEINNNLEERDFDHKLNEVAVTSKPFLELDLPSGCKLRLFL
jgi:hypothetical protein